MIPKIAIYNGGTFVLTMTTPQLEPTDKRIGSRRVYRLTYSFFCTITYPGGHWRIKIPKGFETDFASFPLILQLLLGNRDEYLEESLIHDWLYREGIPPFYANAIMRVVMERLGRAWWKRWLVFYGLMAFGYRAPGWQWLAKLLRRKVNYDNEQQSEGQNRPDQSPIGTDPPVGSDPDSPGTP